MVGGSERFWVRIPVHFARGRPYLCHDGGCHRRERPVGLAAPVVPVSHEIDDMRGAVPFSQKARPGQRTRTAGRRFVSHLALSPLNVPTWQQEALGCSSSSVVRKDCDTNAWRGRLAAAVVPDSLRIFSTVANQNINTFNASLSLLIL